MCPIPLLRLTAQWIDSSFALQKGSAAGSALCGSHTADSKATATQMLKARKMSCYAMSLQEAMPVMQ